MIRRYYLFLGPHLEASLLQEYIHRVGRTARGAEGTGKALLFLMPEELGFLR